jgi:hypothetical protein
VLGSWFISYISSVNKNCDANEAGGLFGLYYNHLKKMICHKLIGITTKLYIEKRKTNEVSDIYCNFDKVCTDIDPSKLYTLTAAAINSRSTALIDSIMLIKIMINDLYAGRRVVVELLV